MFNFKESIENVMASILHTQHVAKKKSLATRELRDEERSLRKEAVRRAKQIKKALEDM